jgi:hypothetical protein
VDPETGTVERHSSGGVARASGAEPVRSDVVPGFEVVPDELFSPPR